MSMKLQDDLAWAHPLVREWFTQKVGKPSEPQKQGWPSILAKKATLISAPTGSGKTFAAFLTCIDQFIRKALAGKLEDQTEVLYVSPLKALSNDIHKNLTGPLNEILQFAEARDLPMSEIRVAVRTGDTAMRERQAMLKKPPHILVTTPESLYILLTAEKSRVMLSNVKTVIIDEIHALADDKRGAHLALSLERLEAITKKKLLRIGLSATQKPLELVANFLIGNHRHQPQIIDIGYVRQLELAIEVPDSELDSVASNTMWDEIYDRIAELAKKNRSTLVFVNTRRLAERISHHLAERLGEDQVLAHHGSLSRKLRLSAETKLKQGELKALVATASLELGIDIGFVDLVCQIGSPRVIATALQRVGRSGHWHQAIAKGRFFATTRDELVECAALIYAIRQGELDKLIIPEQPMDILAQQIIASCATNDWQIKDLFKLVKKAYPYRDLSWEQFIEVIKMLADGIAGSRGRYGVYLFYDQVNQIIKARRGARLTAITSGGAIPENGLFTVITESSQTMVGTLDEDFAVESNRGDIILLGTTSWQIKRIESATGRVIVEDAHGAPPSVPFWRGEAPARTYELSWQVSQLREKINEKLPDPNHCMQWLKANCGLEDYGAEQIVKYLQEGKKILGAVPTQDTVIAERFFDEAGGMQLIIHAPFGARINKAWGLALRKCFCRSFNFELQAAATDDGLNISLAEQHSFPLADVFQFLHPNKIKETLTQAVLQSPLFKTRWRWVATRSLALVRFRGGKKVPPNITRMLSDDLLAAVFPDAAACQDNLAGKDIELPEHPLINETMKDVLTEALDIEGLMVILQQINNGKINCLAVDTPTPSVFSHELLNANPYAYLDDAPLEERRARAVDMRRILPESLLQEIGKLDPAAISEVQQQAWPDIRNTDELHDFLQTVIALPEPLVTNNWQEFINELITDRRIGLASNENKIFYYAAEKEKTLIAIYPHAELKYNLKEIETEIPEREPAILSMIKGWMIHLGPTTCTELAKYLQIPAREIEYALLRLESTGLILRGQYRYNGPEPEWCERRLLARIHRLTVGKLRKEIEPITPGQFMHWLMLWQHILPGTQLRGEHGLLEVIKKLQGFEMAANAWESQILAKRVSDYDSDLLEQLCLRGIIGWGRLSISCENKKRIMPSSVAPITFFVREEADWLPIPSIVDVNESLKISHVAKNIYSYLQKRGASFFFDIVRGVNHLKAEVETGLWELVTAGLITADGFDNLRSLIDRDRRLKKKGRRRVKSYSTGRWCLLHTNEPIDKQKQLEAMCWMLLKRYGVVFRDLIVREKNILPWRELLMTFRRLEDRGEIRGGRFVHGFYGEQFALPYAIESLRSIRKKTAEFSSINLSAVDPLNLVGVILPGERIPAISGKVVAIKIGSEDEN